MASQLQGANVRAFEEGMKKLKMAAIFMIAAAVLTGTGSFASIAATLSSFSSGATPPAPPLIIGAFAGVAIAGAIGGVVILVATFLYLLKSFDKLREFDPGRFSMSATIVKIGFPIYGIMSIIAPIAVFAIASQLAAGPPGIAAVQHVIVTIQAVNTIAFLARLAAMLGIGLGTYRIYELTNDSLYMVAAILFFVAIVVPILSLIAWIIVLISANNAVNRVKSKYVAQPPMPPPPTQQ